jgi:hypothetical protein
MPIEHACTCGAKLKVKDELAGKKIKCPKCSQVSTVAEPTIPTEMIPIRCQCGKSYQAKSSMSGKSFKCSACEQMVSIPKRNEPKPADLDPFGSNLPSNNLANLFDQNFPELGIPTATHVPYQAPVKATAAKRDSAEKPRGITLQFNQDTLVLITAILCILFGLSRLVFLNPLAIFIAPKTVLSVGGMLFLANSLVCIGILVAGIGLLLDQEWSIGVGQIAASMYFVLLLINFGIFFANIAVVMDGKTSVTSLMRGLSSLLGSLAGASVAPGLLLYVTLRND